MGNADNMKKMQEQMEDRCHHGSGRAPEAHEEHMDSMQDGMKMMGRMGGGMKGGDMMAKAKKDQGGLDDGRRRR